MFILTQTLSQLDFLLSARATCFSASLCHSLHSEQTALSGGGNMQIKYIRNRDDSGGFMKESVELQKVTGRDYWEEHLSNNL